MNNLLLKNTPNIRYDKRFDNAYDQMLSQHHLNMTGKYDTSGLGEQDQIKLGNTGAVNRGSAEGRKGDLMDFRGNSIPRGSHVPLGYIQQSRKKGGDQHYVDNPITYGVGGNSWAHPSIPGAFEVARRPEADLESHSEALENREKFKPLAELLGIEGEGRRAVKDSETDPLGIDKSASCNCPSCNVLVKAVLLKAGKKKSKPFHGYNPNKHSKKGGLNAKGRAKAKREEGANLKPPVTTKPSKLKPGSKKAKRRKSFCARMGGVKGPTSKGGKLTPKGASLKRWNC